MGFLTGKTVIITGGGRAVLESGKAGSISQVASLCGFSDSNYFSNTYKKMYGIPPSQAKHQIEQEVDDV